MIDHQWRFASGFAFALIVLLCSGTGSALAAGYEEIDAKGPIKSIAVGDELSCQVAYANDSDFEFYPPDTTPGDCGTMLAVGGVLYAPDFPSHGITATSGLGSYVRFTAVSQTAVEGSGSAIDPYRVTTVVDAGGSGLRITEKTSYVNGSNSYRIDTTVTNRGGSSLNAVLFHAGDCYASGSDIGFGFTRSEVSTAGCSQAAQNSPAGRTVQMAPLSAASQFYEAFYREVWERVGTRALFPNTCRCIEHIDNGVGLSWALSFAPGGSSVRSLAVAFTEATPPAPGLDSDGDALPDEWERGNSPTGDYENLASLGADPTRKDVFVHLDYMDGCKPPVGWERGAIQVFAEHGIALHVDSGPDSINADGQPWGARSRAGAIPYQGNIDLWNAFDRLKDFDFVASNRRRAFHYAAIVNRFNGRDGGLARGIPEADFIFTACSVPPWLRLRMQSYVSSVFVHELGHNLGLRHGGGDDLNGKPNYYGIMNYYWTFFGGVSKKGIPGLLPDYSEWVRPEIDERQVDERVPQILPVAWNCPGSEQAKDDHLDIRYEIGSGTRLVDWDCDGVYGERPYKANLNSTWNDYLGLPKETALTGFKDWRPGVMRFDGAGVLGHFDLPERPSPPVVPELSPEEFVEVHQALRRSHRQARRQLLVESSRRRLRAGRVTTVRIGVRAGGAHSRVRGASIALRGAKLVGPNQTHTDRHGKAVLRLQPKRRGDVRIFATHRGFTRGGLVLSVRRKR